MLVALVAALPASASSGSPDPGIHWESLLPDMPPAGPQPGAVPGCAKPKLACIDTEIRKMRAAQKRFGCDHRGVFATTYLELTKQFRTDLVKRRVHFAHRPYMYTEDALFADVYFNTLRSYAAGKPVAPAWQIAMDTAKSGSVYGAQDMLLGINAHVQNDMPFVVARLGLTTKDGKSRKADHDAFNDVLAHAYEPVVDAIAKRYDAFVSLTNASWDPGDDIGGLELVREWREQVWRNAENLVAAKDAAARAQVASQIEQDAADWAQGIAAVQQPGYRATRDAYCAARLG
ncbi:MAG: hypothetical protein JWM71_1704 [Solirubrobacteraceae bacterium]|nr:hypothetical protein [Solirubrobacteraceae bacterium]